MDLLVVAPGGASIVETLDAVPDGSFVWIDCVYADGAAWTAPVERLTSIHVHDEHLRDAENVHHPSFFDSTDDYEMIVFRGLAMRVDTLDADDVIRVKTRPIVFFVFPRVLVTVRAPDSRLVANLRTRLMTAADRARVPAQPEELMLRILNAMVDRYLELRQPLAAQFDSWQRQLLDTRRRFHDWYSLLEARRQAHRLEELCEEQLDALQEWRDERLERHDGAGLSDALLVRTSDIVEHVHRVRSHAQRLEASLENAVQLHFSATAYRTNEIVRALTAITAVFMPLTLITGIFGMNFEHAPWLHSPAGFWWTIAAMFVLGVLMLLFLRAREVLSASALFGGRSARRRRRRRNAQAAPAASE